MTDILTSSVVQGMTLQVDQIVYTLVFPLSAVAWAEEKLGRSLKSPADWFTAPAKEIPVLLEAGLRKHHPEMGPEEVQGICDCLGPEAIVEVTEALGALAFPRFTERFRANVEALREKGKPLPNASSADAP